MIGFAVHFILDAELVQKGRTVLADWMEFQYKVAELRAHYLMDKRFEEGG